MTNSNKHCCFPLFGWICLLSISLIAESGWAFRAAARGRVRRSETSCNVLNHRILLPRSSTTRLCSVRYQEQWEKQFEALKAYKREHGDTLVPSNYRPNVSLGFWVIRQRQRYKLGKLADDRIRKLNSISFAWNARNLFGKKKTEAERRSWDEKIEELTKYKQKYSTVNVPSSDKDHARLAHWVYRVRKEQSVIPHKERAQLDELGFTWNEANTEKHDRRWEEMFQLLLAYKEEHGSMLVPLRWQHNGVKLGSWVKNQRQRYTDGILQEDRFVKLNSVGFVWRVIAKYERNYPKFEELWNRRYQELVSFKERHGHTRIPGDYSGGKSLLHWVLKQRENYKIGKIREDRKRLLNAIGFDWDCQDSLDASWAESYNEWLEYQRTNDAAMGMGLSSWRRRQWLTYGKGAMDEKRLALLNEIGFFSSKRNKDFSE